MKLTQNNHQRPRKPPSYFPDVSGSLQDATLFHYLTSSWSFTIIPSAWAWNAAKDFSANMSMLHPSTKALHHHCYHPIKLPTMTTTWNLPMASSLLKTDTSFSTLVASSTCRTPLKWIPPNTHAANTSYCSAGFRKVTRYYTGKNDMKLIQNKTHNIETLCHHIISCRTSEVTAASACCLLKQFVVPGPREKTDKTLVRMCINNNLYFQLLCSALL